MMKAKKCVQRAPDFEYVKKTAYKALVRYNITQFPIDLHEIFFLEGIKLKTYSEMAYLRRCSIEKIAKNNRSDEAGIHYNPKRDKYLIIYNDTIDSERRIYWSLAHELGHYLLGHLHELGESKETDLDEPDEKNPLEIEARFFARFFLTPPSVIGSASQLPNAEMMYEPRIMDFFGVSLSVAHKTLDYMRTSVKEYGFGFRLCGQLEDQLLQFTHFLAYGKTCSNCGCFSYAEGAKFCPMCNSRSLTDSPDGLDVTQYGGFKLDRDRRATQCPKCGTKEIWTSRCIKCDTPLINRCTGLNDLNTQYEQGSAVCNLTLNGHARFCHKCGSESSFYTSGFLSPWDEAEKQLYESIYGDIEKEIYGDWERDIYGDWEKDLL